MVGLLIKFMVGTLKIPNNFPTINFFYFIIIINILLSLLYVKIHLKNIKTFSYFINVFNGSIFKTIEVEGI